MATKRKISKKQYERAKRIVSEYESQFSSSVVIRLFTVEDLIILTGSIGVPSLTLHLVNEDFARNLQNKLEDKGYSISYVSLDDLGYISVNYSSHYDYPVAITEKHIEDLLSVLNGL